jgi:integrase
MPENTVQAVKRGKTKSRGNSTGTVYQHRDGKRWCWQITVGYKLGKQIRVSGIAPDKTTAQKAAAKAVTDHERGVLDAPDRTTLAEYTKVWLSRQKGLATSTRRGYEQDLAHALVIPKSERRPVEPGKAQDVRSALARMKLRDIRASHIKDVMSALADREMHTGLGKGRTMASRTLAGVLTRIRAVLREAVSDGLIHVNHAANVKRPKVARTEHPGVALDFDEAARLHEMGEALHAAGAARLWPALFTCASIGLRKGEVMGLTWKHVDFERGVISIRQNLTAPGGKLEMRPSAKTEAGNRDVLMPSSLKAILERHRAAMLEECKIRGETMRLDAPVFPTVEGTFTHPDNLQRALVNLVDWSNPNAAIRQKREKPDVKRRELKTERSTLERRLKTIPRDHRSRLEAVIHSGDPIPRISPHDLRHTAGTLMLRRGVPIEVVSKTLGHSDIALTYSVYRHVLDSEKRQHIVDLFETPLPERKMRSVPVN